MLIRATNAFAMLLALVLSMLPAAAAPALPAPAPSAAAAEQGVRRTVLPDGTAALLDASGHAVPLRPYRRIVAGSTVMDELLLALCEPDRIAGVTAHSAEAAPHRYRFAGFPVHGGLRNVEAIVALEPDLVVTHHIGSVQPLARLRERGIAVFDMGSMRGLRALREDIHQLAHLLGDPERGVAYAGALTRRMAAVSRGLAPERKKRALYVSVHGDRIYGGTRGTSYHDVLTAAGLVDVAAARYRDWPAYSAEEMLALDPDLVITARGMRAVLCGHPGLARLRACGSRGSVIELDPHLISSAGPPMYEAAELLFERVYGGEPTQAAR